MAVKKSRNLRAKMTTKVSCCSFGKFVFYFELPVNHRDQGEMASFKLLIKREEGSWKLLLDPCLSFVQEKKWKKLSSSVEMTVNIPG